MSAVVHVVEFDAAPVSPSKALEVSGAFANVYVVAPNETIALQRALHELREAGWRVSTPGKVSIVNAESFESSEEGLKHYQQSLIDGVVVVLHTWRNEH